jgi:hypothetical protein
LDSTISKTVQEIREQQGSKPKDVPYGAEKHSGSFKKNAKTPQSVK